MLPFRCVVLIFGGSNRYQQVRGKHAGCAEKLINDERERDELRAVNADQASHIKELEADYVKTTALAFYTPKSLLSFKLQSSDCIDSPAQPRWG
ncbi:hypothetical protein Tco_1076039 [Tanacetum coccineum]